jgi:hypothetical protein
MFLIYNLITGELLYEADAAALPNFPTDQFGIVEVSEGWRATHFWDSSERSLGVLETGD